MDGERMILGYAGLLHVPEAFHRSLIRITQLHYKQADMRYFNSLVELSC